MYTRILYLSFQFIWNLKRKYDLYKKLFTKLKKNNLKKYEEINDARNTNTCM